MSTRLSSATLTAFRSSGRERKQPCVRNGSRRTTNGMGATKDWGVDVSLGTMSSGGEADVSKQYSSENESAGFRRRGNRGITAALSQVCRFAAVPAMVIAVALALTADR